MKKPFKTVLRSFFESRGVRYQPIKRRELGVRYVLEGSVRKATNRVRITGQLVDTATGAHLWADRFDGGLGDIFDLARLERAAGLATLERRLDSFCNQKFN